MTARESGSLGVWESGSGESGSRGLGVEGRGSEVESRISIVGWRMSGIKYKGRISVLPIYVRAPDIACAPRRDGPKCCKRRVHGVLAPGTEAIADQCEEN